MDGHIQLLVEILAEVDATWRPMRAIDWHGNTAPVLYERRQAYPTRGVRLHGGGAEAGRKQHQRDLDELVERGFIQLDRREQKRPGALLTELGDLTARALADLPSIDAARASVVEILRLADRQTGLCFEPWLCRWPDYPSDGSETRAEVGVVVRLAAPGLCRGWITSQSDASGRVYYTATDLGREVANGAEFELPDGLPAPHPEAVDAYEAGLLAARSRLRRAAPEAVNTLGYIPLSCSLDVSPGSPIKFLPTGLTAADKRARRAQRRKARDISSK